MRLKPGDDEGGHNMQFLQGLPSNLRHITTNGFGALRKRSRSAPLKLFFFAVAARPIKVKDWDRD